MGRLQGAAPVKQLRQMQKRSFASRIPGPRPEAQIRLAGFGVYGVGLGLN